MDGGRRHLFGSNFIVRNTTAAANALVIARKLALDAHKVVCYLV
jgi:hypothetical protein